MITNHKSKCILCIFLIFITLCNILSTSVQGNNAPNSIDKSLMFFEKEECELGKFSTLSIIAQILDKPGIKGNVLYTTTVLYRVFGLCFEAFFGSTFADYILVSMFSFQEPFKVYGESGLYYRIEYMGKTGYILKTSVELIETQQVVMTNSKLDIYAGQKKSLSLKDETEFSKYTWSSGNSSVAYYDSVNKKVVARNPGSTTIIGMYGNKCAYCTVHVIKKWQQSFNAVAKSDIAFKKEPGNTENSLFTIPKDTKIIVYGNIGKWLYVKCTYKQVDYYGYICYNGSNLTTGTSDSTKGDMLDYATLGWRFPVKDLSYNYISSPYGPRGGNPPRHVGIDIVGKTKGLINEKEVVAACDGTVLSVGSSTAMGNYISITTNNVDTVTKNNLVIVYMHLNEVPQYNNNAPIEKNQPIGFVGSTGNSSGPHLHFDVNNENAICSNSKSGYAYKHSINPMYFFIYQSVILQPCSSPNGLYWPGIE